MIDGSCFHIFSQCFWQSFYEFTEACIILPIVFGPSRAPRRLSFKSFVFFPSEARWWIEIFDIGVRGGIPKNHPDFILKQPNLEGLGGAPIVGNLRIFSFWNIILQIFTPYPKQLDSYYTWGPLFFIILNQDTILFAPQIPPPSMGEVSPPLGPLKGANVAGAVPGGWREAKVERPAALRGAFVGCGHLCFGLQVWMGFFVIEGWGCWVWVIHFFWVFFWFSLFFSSLRWWLDAYFSYKDGLGGWHLNSSERF